MSVLTLEKIKKAMAVLPKPETSRTIDQIILRHEPNEDASHWTRHLELLCELLKMPLEISDKPSIMGIPVILSRAVPEDLAMVVMRDGTVKFLKLTPQDGGK